MLAMMSVLVDDQKFEIVVLSFFAQ